VENLSHDWVGNCSVPQQTSKKESSVPGLKRKLESTCINPKGGWAGQKKYSIAELGGSPRLDQLVCARPRCNAIPQSQNGSIQKIVSSCFKSPKVFETWMRPLVRSNSSHEKNPGFEGLEGYAVLEEPRIPTCVIHGRLRPKMKDRSPQVTLGTPEDIFARLRVS
jgi:hypothetical protein